MEKKLTTKRSATEAIAWAALIFSAFFIGHSAAGSLYIQVFNIIFPKESAFSISNYSTLIGTSLLVGGAFGLITLVAIASKQQVNLHFRSDKKPLKSFHYLSLILSSILISIAVYWLSQREDWQLENSILPLFKTSSFSWLLTIAVITVAPVFEELLFRGYMYQTLTNTKLKLAGALIIPNLIWTLIHLTQYQVIGLATIFAIGMFFGYARWVSGSIVLPVLMHVAFNLTVVILTTVC